MAAKKPAEPKPLEVDGVPTAYGLVRMGLARTSPINGSITIISDEGHAVLGAALRAKAEANIAAGMGDWEAPPSRTDLGNQI